MVLIWIRIWGSLTLKRTSDPDTEPFVHLPKTTTVEKKKNLRLHEELMEHNLILLTWTWFSDRTL